jgi:ubiquinone biosynthesis protein
LYPQINIWEVAHPIVENYIKENIGPKALLRDLTRTVQVLGRFGPKLPQIAEAALMRQTQNPAPPVGRSVVETAGLIALGAVAVSAVYWLVQLVQAL